jgi:hypothetical protein
MITKERILKLIDKYTASSEDEMNKLTKTRTVLKLIQEAIEKAWEFNPIEMTSKELMDSVTEKKLSIGEIYLLVNLLWIQAETLSELQKPLASLKAYEHTFQLLHWLELQVVIENNFKKSIVELRKTIETLKPVFPHDNGYKQLLEKQFSSNSYLYN